MSSPNPLRSIPADLDENMSYNFIDLYHPHFYEVLAKDKSLDRCELILVNAHNEINAVQRWVDYADIFAVTPLIVAASRESKKRLKSYAHTECQSKRIDRGNEFCGGRVFFGVPKELEAYLLKAGSDLPEIFTVTEGPLHDIERAMARRRLLAAKSGRLKIG